MSDAINELMKLTKAIRESIIEYKENGGLNENAFSLNARIENDTIIAECSFNEDYNMTIMYGTNTDNDTVASLYHLQNNDEMERLAFVMLDNEWIERVK